MTPLPAIVVVIAALTACTDYRHEPVKVLHGPAPAPSASLPLDDPAPVGPASAVLPHHASPSSAPEVKTGIRNDPPSPIASAPAKVPEPAPFGKLEGPSAPAFVQPGEPTGNDAFRKAIIEKAERIRQQ